MNNITGILDANIQQIKDCLQEYNTFGQKHIINICTQKETIIPWGIEIYGNYIAIFLALIIMIIIIKSSYHKNTSV